MLNSNPESHWICIGADANDDSASHGWDGDVSIARIYDKALTDKDIEHFFMDDAKLWADWGEEYGPGGSGFVRMNIATTSERLETALANLKKAYKNKFN